MSTGEKYCQYFQKYLKNNEQTNFTIASGENWALFTFKYLNNEKLKVTSKTRYFLELLKYY